MQETQYAVPDCPVSLALITDIHDRPKARILSSLRAHRPDAIAIAGDLIRASWPDFGLRMEQSPLVIEFLAECARLAPTYVSLGNHEGVLVPGDIELIRKTGCVLLDDAWTKRGGVVWGGLTSVREALCAGRDAAGKLSHRVKSWKRRDHTERLKEKRAWLDAFCATSGYHILLCHHPEYWEYLKSLPIELMLSGHAHGGQWRYYSVRRSCWEGVFAPGQGFFPKLTSGMYDRRLIVSRGLANTAPVPRFFNPTEIVYVN